MENIAVTVAQDIIDKELLFEIIYSIINEEDFNENLKIKIYNTLKFIEMNENYEELNLGLDNYYNFL